MLFHPSIPIPKKIHSFQYLTQDLATRTHPELMQAACQAGVRWLQLRCKNKAFEDWRAIATECREICTHFDAKLIINDSVEICRAVNADGVHLGKNDLSPAEARRVLGADKIIGATANDWNDIQRLSKTPVDYLGVGPFRFTSTKQQLSPVLGLEMYQLLVQKMKNHQINLPIVAIGGIQVEDVSVILATGIHGLAVSSAVHGDGVDLEKLKQKAGSFLAFF